MHWVDTTFTKYEMEIVVMDKNEIVNHLKQEFQNTHVRFNINLQDAGKIVERRERKYD